MCSIVCLTVYSCICNDNNDSNNNNGSNNDSNFNITKDNKNDNDKTGYRFVESVKLRKIWAWTAKRDYPSGRIKGRTDQES